MFELAGIKLKSIPNIKKVLANAGLHKLTIIARHAVAIGKRILIYPLRLSIFVIEIVSISESFSMCLLIKYKLIPIKITFNSKTKGTIEQKQFVINKSKDIIDEIDTALAAHYGFTPEELDFIINYDIKYRMGKELEEDE